jgi:hypothetical protein
MFLSFPDVIEHLTTGMTDIMSVVVSIWAVYFALRAVKEPRYFRLAVPLVAAAFLTRFTGGIMVLCLVFVVLFTGRVKPYARDVWRGIVYSGILLVPYFAYYWISFGDPLIQLGEPFRAATATERVGMLAGQIKPPTFFLYGIPDMLSASPVRFALLGVLVIGGMATVMAVVRSRTRTPRASAAIALAAGVAGLFAALFAQTSIVFVAVGWLVLLGWAVPRAFGLNDDRDALVISAVLFWLLLYFSTHSYMIVKVTRYYITMLPALVFVMLMGVEWWVGLADSRRAASRATWAGVTTALAVAILLSGVESFRYMESLPLWNTTGYEEAKTWMDGNVPPGEERVASDAYPNFRWHLARSVYPVPPFDTPEAVHHWLNENGMEYFVTNHTYEPITSFEVAASFGDATIWRRSSQAPTEPTVLLIGRSVDRHLRDVLDYQGLYVCAPLPMIPDDYSNVEGTFIDEYTLEELQEYDAVLLYDFRWHDLGQAEALLTRYISDGGTLMIDTSRNRAGLPETPYGLDRGVFMGVLSDREPVAELGEVTVIEDDMDVKDRTPEFGPFIAEDGGAWIGTTYSVIDGPPLDALVLRADRPLVSQQTIGKGRIIWVGDNLVFHSFLRGTDAEHDFIRELFEHATGRSGHVASERTRGDT